MIDVKLDRVTVVGHFKSAAAESLGEYLRPLGWQDMSFDWEHGMVDGYVLKRILSNCDTETVAVIVKNQYQTTWRLDTSNHFRNDEEKRKVIAALDLFENKHLSRIDIAFDFINMDNAGMRHRFVKSNVTTTEIKGESLWIRGRNSHLQTLYAGKRKSLSLFRYYDKVAEQKRHRKEISEDIESWERLELQVRAERANEWLLNSRAMLSYFKLPQEYVLDPKDRAMLLALNAGHVSYKELAKATAAKYRKLAKSNLGFDDSWAKEAYKKLEEKQNELQKAVNSFVSLINV